MHKIRARGIGLAAEPRLSAFLADEAGGALIVFNVQLLEFHLSVVGYADVMGAKQCTWDVAPVITVSQFLHCSICLSADIAFLFLPALGGGGPTFLTDNQKYFLIVMDIRLARGVHPIALQMTLSETIFDNAYSHFRPIISVVRKSS